MTTKEREEMKKQALNSYANSNVNYFGTNSRRD